MSAGTDQLRASIDALESRLLAESRRNGRLEFAGELAEWANENARDLQPHIRTALAEFILTAGR
jgi:hypothetical protein